MTYTKKGPGRVRRHGKPGNRLDKQKPLRAYRALVAHYDNVRVGQDSRQRNAAKRARRQC